MKTRIKKESCCGGMLPDPVGMERIPGGLGHNSDPGEFDQDQLMKGIHIELEHGTDVVTAMEIAMDHLSENPFYYDYLDDMEKRMDGNKIPKLEDIYSKNEVEVYQHQAHKVTNKDLDPLGTGTVHNKYPLKFKLGH